MALINVKTIAKAKDRNATVTKGGVVYQSVDTAALAEVANIAKNLASNSSDWTKIDQKDKAVLAAALKSLAAAMEESDSKYLSKVHADTAAELITFLKGFVSQGTALLRGGAEFGIFVKDASGAALYMDNDGLWHCETDFMHVRHKLTAKEVQIEEVTHIGGQQLLTAAQMNCAFVADKGDYYRCFFNKEGSDGRKVTNKWKTGDQAYACTFNLEEQADGTLGNHYFWRLVTGTSNDGADTSEYEVDGETVNGGDYHYIDLSKSVASSGSDEPKPGDNIVQLGYRGTDIGASERQAAILMAGAGNASPYIREFTGINSFSLPEPDIQLKPGNNILTGRVRMTAGSTLNDIDLGQTITQLGDKADAALGNAAIAKQTADAAGDAAATASQHAQDAADSAQSANDTATQSLEIARNLSTGNGNLLRNSGFTGDYLDENVAPLSNVNQGTEMYSDPFDHWTHQNAEVILSPDSASGAAAVLSNGSLSQTLERGVEEGKEYVFSFKGKGTSLQFSVGGFSQTVTLNSTVDRYNVKFTAASSGTAFAITGSTCTVMELQLIEGNIPFNNWVNHPKDNDKSLAYFQNFTYLLEAIVNGRTDILGGLILSNMVKVGNYRNNQPLTEQDETGGMSGIYTSPDSPFIWGGGSKTKAHYTIAKYAENPNYEPTAEELANDMAQFVVTHGGRVILNDIIARGVIIATSGIFKNITSPHGNFRIDENGFAHLECGGRIGGFNIQGSGLTNMKQNGEFDTETYVIFRNDEHQMFAGIGNVLPSYTGARATGRFENFDENRLWGIGTNYGLLIGARNADENIAVLLEGGSVARFALRTESISENNKTLSILSGSVVFLNSEAITTKLPAVKSYDNGHSVKLKSLSRSAATIYPSTFDKTITPVGWQNLAWGGSGYTANANACSVRLDYRNPISMALTLKKGYILRFDQWDVNTNTPIESLTDSSHRTSTSNRPADSADRTLDESFLSTTGIVILTVTKISGEAITPSEASAAVGRVETTFNTFIHYNGGDIATPADSSCELYDGIGMELVFHADVITQKDNKHYVGCWAQYKHNW